MFSHNKKTIQLYLSWLTVSFILVFSMIVIGGLTRLTDSGLSITEWELFSGILPPFSNSKWEEYFLLYKNIPQFKLINPNMTIDEFKIIFYWEYIHRFLGRLIGLFFLVPLLYFHFIKKINVKYLIINYLLLFLVILQGFIGWYMVTSGLVNDVTVSHYRLSIHLTVALIIISIIFWQILNLKKTNFKKFFSINKKNLPYFLLIVLIFFQIIIGAFVSGLDAGKIYQTWPLMGSSYVPDDLIINNFSNYLNFDNHSLVQFYHRNLAYLICVYILILSIGIFILKNYHLYKPVLILLFILLIQIFLGILALKSNLHIFVASAHQISSVILVLSAINLYYSVIK